MWPTWFICILKDSDFYISLSNFKSEKCGVPQVLVLEPFEVYPVYFLLVMRNITFNTVVILTTHTFTLHCHQGILSLLTRSWSTALLTEFYGTLWKFVFYITHTKNVFMPSNRTTIIYVVCLHNQLKLNKHTAAGIFGPIWININSRKYLDNYSIWWISIKFGTDLHGGK